MPKTHGEVLFESYLESHGYAFEFEKEFTGKLKRPDYCVERIPHNVLCEMKDFEQALPPLGQVVSIDPYPRLREKINQAARKFKEYKGETCCLGLYNDGNFFVDLETAAIVLGSMYGDAGLSISVPSDRKRPLGPTKEVFLKRGKMIQPGLGQPQNTTISALVTLRHVSMGRMKLEAYLDRHPEIQLEEISGLTSEKVGFDTRETRVGVIVWENAVAAKPLSRDIFNGDFDIRWGVEDGEQKIVHYGACLPPKRQPKTSFHSSH